MPQNLSRYRSESNLPRPRSPELKRPLSTEVFVALARVTFLSREDPDQLAVACAAWCRLGYPPYVWLDYMQHGSFAHGFSAGAEVWDFERAHDVSRRALHNRQRRLLTAKADGLIAGLIHLAEDSNRARLHDLQVETATIECRKLSFEERGSKLREMEASRG